MTDFTDKDVEEWARELAEHAAVPYVPLIRSERYVTRVKVTWLFDRTGKFEVCQVSMWLVMLGYEVSLRRHAEQWLVVEAMIPNEKFARVMTYERQPQEDGPTLNQQQQAAAAWDKVDEHGYKVTSVDGAEISVTDAMLQAMAEHEREQRAAREKKARERNQEPDEDDHPTED
ncbi:hypothetical protein H9W91_07365 [Streptomyces alfalfae]|uniref:hypothetical protein n=1 Tax=Streptomyces alfalfae TaxID=1642299 RepID=UPI001BA50674|nr:hypothetical protein [Streptomyces alfalfae]QUI30697.1 hypothetical protein H9W91_07365 [Streptomyces alfalfae]